MIHIIWIRLSNFLWISKPSSTFDLFIFDVTLYKVVVIFSGTLESKALIEAS